jgi:uncharacterized cupin superfamily protein
MCAGQARGRRQSRTRRSKDDGGAIEFRSLGRARNNATAHPERFGPPFSAGGNRRLGDHAKLTNFGVNLTRLPPGAHSSARHAHSRQDEFIYVLKGVVELERDAGVETLSAGLCAGFPAGTGNAHRFVNRSAEDVLLLIVGDRTAGDEVTYPDIDMHARMGDDGKYKMTRKDGTPY